VKSEIKDVSSVRKVFTVTVSKDEAQNEEGLLIKAISSDAKMPGFRKGHVPEAIVRTKFAKDLKARLDDQLYSRAMETMAKEYNVKIFSMIKADFIDKESGEKELTMIFDIKPDFDMVDYKHIELDPIDLDVVETEIDSAIEQLRNYNADYRTVDRSVKKGDFVRLSYHGILNDGTEISKLDDVPQIWGEKKDAWEEAGAEDVLGVKAVIEGIVDMNVDGDKEIETTFPDDFSVKPLAGKTVKYMVHVSEIREKVLPELDDNLFKKLKANNLEELRASIVDDLKKRKYRFGRLEQREQMVRKLIASADFDVPESAIEHERIQVLRTFLEQQIREGIPVDELEKHKAELYNDTIDLAGDRAKINFILERIAIEEKITVSANEMSQMIIQEASMLRTTPDALVNEIKNDKVRVQDLQRRTLFSKTLDFLVLENIKNHPNLTKNDSNESADDVPNDVVKAKSELEKKSDTNKLDKIDNVEKSEDENISSRLES
jgi:trigger factor